MWCQSYGKGFAGGRARARLGGHPDSRRPTSSPTPASNAVKFFSNRRPGPCAIRSYAALSAQACARIQHLVGTPGTCSGIARPKNRSLRNRIRARLPSSAARSSARVWLDAHALADAVLPAAPTGIHQPAIRVVARDQLRQHAAIHFGPARQERRAETGAERRLRLRAEALLGAGDQRGVAGQEMIHRLRRRQLRDRRHHAECIAGQHHHVARLAAAAARVRCSGCTRPDSRSGCSRSAI